MKYRSHNFFIAVTACLFFLSCEGPEGSPGPQGPQGIQGDAGSVSAGDLFGYVRTYDEFGALLQDHSGVTVTVEGSDPLITIQTDAEGKYYIEDLTTGTYNLVFTKEGFQTQKAFSYQFVGGGAPVYNSDSPQLSEISTTSITHFSISVTDEDNPDTALYTMIKIDYAISPEYTEEEPRPTSIFFSTSTDVSSINYERRLNLRGNVTVEFDKFPENTTLYGILYPTPEFCVPYYDPFLEITDWSCYGTPSDIASVAIP